MPERARPLRVVVIGAGVVGAACAVSLLDDGADVTIVEPGEPGGEQAASYGNGCWLSPASIVPSAVPGLWRKVPRYLADPLGPLAIRPGYLPRLAPWLLRTLRAGSSLAKVQATARALRPLLADAPLRHKRLADAAGCGDLIERRGLLYVFPSRAAFAAEALGWRLRRENGIAWIELDANELHQREPNLDRRYGFGVLLESGGHCIDPGGYVAGLVQHAKTLGARLHPTRAVGFAFEGRRLRAVRTEAGDIGCDRAVIAAGAYSRPLAIAAGDRVSLETERGYHALIAAPECGPRTPLMPSDGKMANTMTPAGLRIAGQVELAGLAAAPNWKRAEILRDFALKTYPGLPRTLAPERVRFWMGHRPSTPDGLPCIGPASGSPDVVCAFGHGHVGLAAAATTAALVAGIIAKRSPAIDLAPYSPQRFR